MIVSEKKWKTLDIFKAAALLSSRSYPMFLICTHYQFSYFSYFSIMH